jgi:D-alanyl-D-alanine carboxypeptidase/D-alanyl-D-alanine-endopeptidase (penicillin-binding protein 4)
MKTSFHRFIAGLAALGTFAAPATAASDDIFREALVKRLTFIFKDEKLEKTALGVEVFSLSRQETLFSLNSSAALSPASAIKLLTGFVALKRLGPDFTFKTEVYADGPISGGVLRGNLYLKGGGDPSLVTERMFLLVNDIARNSFRQVSGSLFVDDSTFDEVKIDPNRLNTDTDRAYNAPVGGLSFNYNTTTAYFRPGASIGDRPSVFIEPDTGYMEVSNKAKTGPRGSGYNLVASRVKGTGGDSLLVKGSIPLGMSEQKSHFNIAEPAIYAGQALRYMLANRGIRVAGGEIKRQTVPSSARKIAELESLPLREIVTLMNKYSSNFIADTLVKTLGREVRGAPGTMPKGLEVLREEATKVGVNTAGFNLVSGSGLTRENRTSASQFVSLMNAAYLDFDVLPELLASLPIAGKDGTLRNRMKGTSAYGRLRGKTGTIDGVSALVGIVQSKGGELLAFSVLMNDKTKDPGSFKPWQNYFGQALADFNRKTPLSEKPLPLPDVIQGAGEEKDDAPAGLNLGGRR